MEPKAPSENVQTASVATMRTVYSVLGGIVGILFHAGAAKLSYDKYGSIGWAILAFLFGTFYYPYYAFFISGNSSAMLGGLRKMKW
jgi:hypothetical protein